MRSASVIAQRLIMDADRDRALRSIARDTTRDLANLKARTPSRRCWVPARDRRCRFGGARRTELVSAGEQRERQQSPQEQAERNPDDGALDGRQLVIGSHVHPGHPRDARARSTPVPRVHERELLHTGRKSRRDASGAR